MILANLFPDPPRAVTVGHMADVSCKCSYNQGSSISSIGGRPKTKTHKVPTSNGTSQIMRDPGPRWVPITSQRPGGEPKRSNANLQPTPQLTERVNQ